MGSPAIGSAVTVMRSAMLLLAASLAFSAVALLPSASATGCDPHNGPFDPCFYNCNPGFEPECELIIGGGQTVWHYYCDRIAGC